MTLFRAYDPNEAKWLSSDPLEERGGINLYGYVGNDPVNWTDPTGLGKLGYAIRAAKGGWKAVSKMRALKALTKAEDAMVEGTVKSKGARNLGREMWGSKTVRHDPHEAGQMSHYQHKNGGRGHVFYSVLEALTASAWLGENAAGDTYDATNPFSDIKSLIDEFQYYFRD